MNNLQCHHGDKRADEKGLFLSTGTPDRTVGKSSCYDGGLENVSFLAQLTQISYCLCIT